MRKVGVTGAADAHLEESLASFQAHWDRSVVQWDSLRAGRGLEGAIQSHLSLAVAQYASVLERLGRVRDLDSEGKYLSALREEVRGAVGDLRDGGTPEWRLLATATVLEVLERCVELEAE